MSPVARFALTLFLTAVFVGILGAIFAAALSAEIEDPAPAECDMWTIRQERATILAPALEKAHRAAVAAVLAGANADTTIEHYSVTYWAALLEINRSPAWADFEARWQKCGIG